MFRKWWFWVIGVLSLVIIAGSACGIIILAQYAKVKSDLAALEQQREREAENLARQSAQALADFWDTYDSLVVVEDRECAIWEEFNENVEKLNAIRDEATGLYAGPKLKKLAQEGLDSVAERQEILGRIRQAIYDESAIISQLHGNVTRITDPTQKSLAQEIAAKLRELNNLKLEELALWEKEARYWEEDFRNILFVSQGKMSMDEVNERLEELNKLWEEIDSKLDELWNARDALNSEVSDLAAKLRNL